MGSKNMPWFRLYTELASDVKFAVIANRLQYNRPFVIGLWVLILCIASDSPIRGKLYAHSDFPLTDEELGLILDMSDDIGYLLEILVKLGMLIVDEHGAYCISNWDERQYINNSTERSRKHRDDIDATEMQRKCNGNATFSSVSESVSESLTKEVLKDNEVCGTQKILETVVGLPVAPADMAGMDELERLGVTEDDVRGALQWRKDNARPPVKTLSQLYPGIRTQYSIRTQGSNARASPTAAPLSLEEEIRLIRKREGLE